MNADLKPVLVSNFRTLINVQLPSAWQFPVKYNHCFNRIILDWLFNDCWYNYLNLKKTAISQLTDAQLQSAIERMKEWLADQNLLISDNQKSLEYRKTF